MSLPMHLMMAQPKPKLGVQMDFGQAEGSAAIYDEAGRSLGTIVTFKTPIPPETRLMLMAPEDYFKAFPAQAF